MIQCASPTIQASELERSSTVGWTSTTRHSCSGATVELEDARRDYRERSILCYGVPEHGVVASRYTPRDSARHVYGVRKAIDREQTRPLAPYLEIRTSPALTRMSSRAR